jgi:hypothetical protein
MSMAFSASEMERLLGCLARLMPHVRRDDIAIAGGVGMQLGLVASGHPSSREAFADLDPLFQAAAADERREPVGVTSSRAPGRGRSLLP